MFNELVQDIEERKVCIKLKKIGQILQPPYAVLKTTENVVGGGRRGRAGQAGEGLAREACTGFPRVL